MTLPKRDSCHACNGRFPAFEGKARKHVRCKACGTKYSTDLPPELDLVSRVRWTAAAVFIFTGWRCHKRRRSARIKAYVAATREAGFTGAIFHFDPPELGEALKKELHSATK